MGKQPKNAGTPGNTEPPSDLVAMASDTADLAPVHTAELDWFLQFLVYLANTSSLEVALTVQVGGLIVSGTLVSGATYGAAVSDRLDSIAFGDADDDSPPLTYKSMGDVARAILEDAYGERDRSDEPAHYEPQFIHLKDARIFAPGAPALPTNEPFVWRGRLASVDGFFIGNLSSEASRE